MYNNKVVGHGLSGVGIRPSTGKLKHSSQDQGKLNKIQQNDRSRQKQGVMAALPSSQ